MSIGARGLIVCGLVLMSSAACDRPVNASLPSTPAAAGERTIKTVPLNAPGTPGLIGLEVVVEHGNIDILVMDVDSASPRVLGMALEDEVLFSQTLTESVTFEDGWLKVYVGDAAAANGPLATTRLRAPRGAALNLTANNGSIAVAGQAGQVTAVANGPIEIRGPTGALNLATHGDAHSILVLGGVGDMDLKTDNGSIDIMADNVRVQAVTGLGDIRFAGTLRPGVSYFTVTQQSNITVITPLDFAYRFRAETLNNVIKVEGPSRLNSAYSTVCGVADAGWPIALSLEQAAAHNGDQSQTHVTINQGSTALATAVWAAGVVTGTHVEFHTNSHAFAMYVDDPSDVAIDTDETSSPGGAPVAAAPGAAATPDATLQALVRSDPTLQAAVAANPDLRTAIEGFTGADSGGTGNPTPAAARTALGAPAGFGAALNMRGENCRLGEPVPGADQPPVRIRLTSGGGRIRLLQVKVK